MDRTANAVWKGNLTEGKGTLDTQSGVLKGSPYSFKMRFQDESGTPAAELDAKAVVTLVPGTGITGSAITLVGKVPGIDAAKFKELAEKAKAECPVSKALGAIKVSLDARLA